MKNRGIAFNIILAVVFLFGAGCETPKKKKEKEGTFLRMHLETNRDGTQHSMTVPVYRARPVYVSVQTSAALDEGFLKKAEVVDVDPHGGFAIKLTFTEEGKTRFDYLTTANKGLRLGIHARWTEDRWLAAPLITKRIDSGEFIFTPDATREETDRIVWGLNNVIKDLLKPYVF